MGLLSKRPEGKKKLTINELHALVDNTVIADADAAWYEVVFAPDADTSEVHIAEGVFIDHANKQLRIVI